MPPDRFLLSPLGRVPDDRDARLSHSTTWTDGPPVLPRFRLGAPLGDKHNVDYPAPIYADVGTISRRTIMRTLCKSHSPPTSSKVVREGKGLTVHGPVLVRGRCGSVARPSGLAYTAVRELI